MVSRNTTKILWDIWPFPKCEGKSKPWWIFETKARQFKNHCQGTARKLLQSFPPFFKIYFRHFKATSKIGQQIRPTSQHFFELSSFSLKNPSWFWFPFTFWKSSNVPKNFCCIPRRRSPLPSPILKVLTQFGSKVAFAVQMSKVEATLWLDCATF